MTQEQEQKIRRAVSKETEQGDDPFIVDHIIAALRENNRQRDEELSVLKDIGQEKFGALACRVAALEDYVDANVLRPQAKTNKQLLDKLDALDQRITENQKG